MLIGCVDGAKSSIRSFVLFSACSLSRNVACGIRPPSAIGAAGESLEGEMQEGAR